MELQSLHNVFSNKLLRIPDYQRGYAWGEQQLKEFWEDLIDLEENRSHYTGVLSLKKVERDVWKHWHDERWLMESWQYVPFFVVDGQQRLTTAVILLQVLVEFVRQLPNEEDREYLGLRPLTSIVEDYLFIEKPPKKIIKTYKFGYEIDNPGFKFLRYRIFNESNEGVIEETFYTLNLENAKKFFTENVKALFEAQGKSALESVFTKLTQRFMFNEYKIGDDFDVFVAFETMNNRGKKLSNLELLKNRLIYLSTLYSDDELSDDERKKLRDNINDAWKEVYYHLGRNKRRPLDDDDFLRAHWIMYLKYTRQKGKDYINFLLNEQFSPKNVRQKVEIKTDSMKQVEEMVGDEVEIDYEEDEEDEETASANSWEAKLTPSDINDYVLSLKESARHWYNSYNPENNPDLTKEDQLWLDRLNRIGMGYFRPLVMSAFSTSDVTSNERVKLFKAIERFIFVIFRVSQSRSNYGSSTYYNAARHLYKGKHTVSDITNWLHDDVSWKFSEGKFKYETFQDSISQKYNKNGTGFYGWSGLRYFLFEYESELARSFAKHHKVTWKDFTKGEKDKVSIEHIYPQKHKRQCWRYGFGEFTTKQRKYLCGSLGNLLLLSSKINASLQNDCFADKKRTKRDKNGKVLRNGYADGSFSELEVSHYEQWTAQEIKERGLKLLRFMETRWDMPLGDEGDKLKLLHLDFMRENED